MTYDVAITPLEISALFDLKGAPADLAAWAGDTLPAFPVQPNTLIRMGERTLLWTGQNRWLLRAPLVEEAALLAVLRPEEVPAAISIVHVSDTLSFFAITGPDAAAVMAIASPLDLHADVFPETGATFTEAFGLRALVLRRDGGFELAVDRSFAPMVEEYLGRIIG